MIKNIHLLFEQSGTFKNEFKKLGYKAYDYDILNDFNETDNVYRVIPAKITGNYSIVGWNRSERKDI